MKKIKKIRRGFTLIEVLVVIFVIGVISSIVVSGWRRNEKKYQLQMAAQMVVQNIRKAQDMALAGKAYGGQLPNYSYGIYFRKTDPSYYVIFGDKNGNNTYQPADEGGLDIKVDHITMESGIETALLTSQSLNIVFTIPDGFTIITPSATSATIIVKRTGATCPSSDCKNVVVRNTGQVTIQ